MNLYEISKILCGSTVKFTHSIVQKYETSIYEIVLSLSLNTMFKTALIYMCMVPTPTLSMIEDARIFKTL
jgi:hypothetical protein